MKKIILYIIVCILFILIFFVGVFCYLKYEENMRYEKILKDFEDAVIWKLDATGMSKKICEPNVTKKSIISSKHLIQQGYLKKESMVDINEMSYCSAYAKTFDTDDCGVDYKIYLKCKNFETSGYIGWD